MLLALLQYLFTPNSLVLDTTFITKRKMLDEREYEQFQYVFNDESGCITHIEKRTVTRYLHPTKGYRYSATPWKFYKNV